MRIVIDECVLRTWFAYLQQAGHTVEDWITVGGGQGKTDDALIAWAQGEDTVVLTADNDLGQIVWAQGADRPTVVQLDDPAFRPPDYGLLVLTALAECQHRSDRRFYIRIRRNRTYRIRALPLR